MAERGGEERAADRRFPDPSRNAGAGSVMPWMQGTLFPPPIQEPP
jgi:hypothetical protein